MILWALMGVALLVLVVYDLVTTSLAIEAHGGPLTRRLSAWAWAVSNGPTRRPGRRGTKVGPRVLLALVVGWLALSWIGWFLVFLGAESAVVSTTTGMPADVVSRLYYAGFTLFTLGLGDYRPEGGVWQVATALAAGQGFFVFTLSVTFAIPVISAATRKREVAQAIGLLGADPTDIVARAWNGRDFGLLPLQLTSLGPSVLSVQQKHFAYPILHYFVANEPEASLGRAAAVLDEALLILQDGIHEAHRPETSVLEGLHEALLAFATTRRTAQAGKRAGTPEEAPPVPSLEPLRRLGVPVVEDARFEAAAQAAAERRRTMLALVLHEGWSWDDVASSKRAHARDGSGHPPDRTDAGTHQDPDADGTTGSND